MPQRRDTDGSQRWGECHRQKSRARSPQSLPLGQRNVHFRRRFAQTRPWRSWIMPPAGFRGGRRGVRHPSTPLPCQLPAATRGIGTHRRLKAVPPRVVRLGKAVQVTKTAGFLHHYQGPTIMRRSHGRRVCWRPLRPLDLLTRLFTRCAGAVKATRSRRRTQGRVRCGSKFCFPQTAG